MNTTPKQQDDGDIAAADGSRPALEQTVLGIAPPPSGVTPTSVAPRPAPSEAPPADGGSALVAAPTIAVAEPRALDFLAQAEAPASPAVHASPAPGVGDTLPLPRPAALAVPRPEPDQERSTAAHDTNGALALDHTALSADYLRAAREAAFSQLAGGPSSPSGTPAAESSASAAMVEEPAPNEAQTIEATPKQPRVEAPPGVTIGGWIATPPMGAAPAGAERNGPPNARCFEPVPVVRAPLAESLSGALSPLAEVGSHRNLPPPRPRPPAPSREAAGRWLLLASVALATVGIVTFGSRLVNRYRNSAVTAGSVATDERVAPNTSAPTLGPSSAASRATLANRPAAERGAADGRPRVVSATGAPGARAVSEESPGASASPESQLAAAAGRHVLTGNFAEALPLYRQLERNWPENTAYAAMARLLEKRVGSTNDTRTISPTTPRP